MSSFHNKYTSKKSREMSVRFIRVSKWTNWLRMRISLKNFMKLKRLTTRNWCSSCQFLKLKSRKWLKTKCILKHTNPSELSAKITIPLLLFLSLSASLVLSSASFSGKSKLQSFEMYAEEFQCWYLKVELDCMEGNILSGWTCMLGIFNKWWDDD